MIKLRKSDRLMPHSLRRRVYTFGFTMTMMVVLVGTFLGLMVFRSISSYQNVMNQLTEIQQLKADISAVGEMIQNRVVLGEENDAECRDAWEEINLQIETLEMSHASDMVRLLMQDLQAYQANTSNDFYELLLWIEGADISERYQRFCPYAVRK